MVLRAYNDSNPGGVSATVTVQVLTQPIHYVSLDSAAPQPALRLVGDGSDHHPGCGGRRLKSRFQGRWCWSATGFTRREGGQSTGP